MTTNTKNVQSIAKEIGGECIAVRVRLLNRVITNIYDDAFRPLGITVNQMSILISMIRNGFSKPAEFGNYLHMEKSTLSRNLERMRKSGWIEILAGDDARSQFLRMTPKGKKVVEQSWPLWKSAQKKAKKTLGDYGATAVCETADDVWSRESET